MNKKLVQRFDAKNPTGAEIEIFDIRRDPAFAGGIKVLALLNGRRAKIWLTLNWFLKEAPTPRDDSNPRLAAKTEEEKFREALAAKERIIASLEASPQTEANKPRKKRRPAGCKCDYDSNGFLKHTKDCPAGLERAA